MVTAKMTVIISAMIDKMGIELGDIEGKTQKEIGEKLIGTLLKNLYKAEPEFYRLLAENYGITPEEAEKQDIIKALKDIMKETGIAGLFS